MTDRWEGLEVDGGRRLQRDPAHGFYRVVPPPSDEELAAFYTNTYRSPCVPHDPEGRVDIITNVLRGPGRVLDVGCGGGEFLACFKDRGWKTVGIEPAQEYAAAARARGIDVIAEPLTPAVARGLGTFDAVLLCHVLEHLPRPEGMVGLIHRLLAPGGVFYCEVPNDFNPLQESVVAAQGLRPWWIALPDHLNYFSIDSLAAFITANGFDVEVKTTDFPVEMFLLWGDVYVDNPPVGKMMHGKRVRFEQTLRETGRGALLQDFYRKIAEIGIGREAIVCARKRG
jgi:SAM-dependent methyltransferase